MQFNSTGQYAPTSAMPNCLSGFSHINRYWDKYNQRYAAKILPGEYYVTVEEEVIVTVLGSCISACVRDRVFRIGGMNHFMLPGGDVATQSGNWASAATRYGNYAMEALINEILKQGGRKENLEVKIFGGGRILENMTDVGNKNIAFIHSFIETEGLTLLAENVGDIYPRKVQYSPMTGKVKMKKLRSLHNNSIVERETSYMDSLDTQPIEGEIDLF